MPSLNKVIVIGHIGKMYDTRTFDSGTTIASFSVATTETWKDKKTGEKKEHVEWHNITTFGKLAEVVTKYAGKGMLVYVEGSLRTDKYKDKDGNEKQSTKINADKVLFLSRKKDEDDEPARPSKPAQQSIPDDDDDVPFN